MLFFQWDEWKLSALRDYPSPLALPPTFLSSTPSWDAGTAAVGTWHINNKAISALQWKRVQERHTGCFFTWCDGEEGLGSCSWSFFCLLLFVNQGVLVDLSHIWCCIAFKLSNLSLSTPLARKWVFLWLTSNAYTCISVLRKWYYLSFSSKIALNFIQDMCNLI